MTFCEHINLWQMFFTLRSFYQAIEGRFPEIPAAPFKENPFQPINIGTVNYLQALKIGMAGGTGTRPRLATAVREIRGRRHIDDSGM